MYSLILLSGGVGSRMRQAVPKQYMLLAGKPVIMHILERIDEIAEIKETIIVCAQEYVSSILLMMNQYGIRKTVKFAPAGNTRQGSVKSGLSMVETEHVVIHEAARPFVKVEDFRSLLDDEAENAMFGLEIPFTVIKGDDYVNGLLNRSELVNVQLPQKFRTDLIKAAHDKAEADGRMFTEDASLVYEYYPDIKIKILKGHEYNLKITTRMDMILGEQIYKEELGKRV